MVGNNGFVREGGIALRNDPSPDFCMVDPFLGESGRDSYPDFSTVDASSITSAGSPSISSFSALSFSASARGTPGNLPPSLVTIIGSWGVMNCAWVAVPDPSGSLAGVTCDSFSAWCAYLMAAMAVVEEVEDTEAFEAPDASLSVRVECLCMFVLVGNVVSSRYRQCHQVENPDMSKPIESRVSTNEAVKSCVQSLDAQHVVGKDKYRE
jgi:hypothetical protein